MTDLNKPESVNPDQLEKLIDIFGLPLHVIFTERLQRNISEFTGIVNRAYSNSLVTFAVKSNPCRGAVRAVAKSGIGIDAVSEFELKAALEEGVNPSKIICNGNAKPDRYINLIVDSGALTAVDSYDELEVLDQIAGQKDKRVPALLRFAGMSLTGLTSADQSTASPWTKFGFSFKDAQSVFRQTRQYSHVDIVGISAHIGTQICDRSGYLRLFQHFFDLYDSASHEGLIMKYLDIGGGFPVSYISKVDWEKFQERLRLQLNGKLLRKDWVTWDNTPLGYGHLNRPPNDDDPWLGKAYYSKFTGADMVRETLSCRMPDGETVGSKLKSIGLPALIIEPGRALLGTAGITAAEVMTIKRVEDNLIVAVDMGINNHGTNLVTPDIFPMEVLPSRSDDTPIEAFIAGRLCFTGDMISKVKVRLNRQPKRGDLLVIHHTGAYCADHFASNSCGFPRPAKVTVDREGKVEVWRERESFSGVFGDVNRTKLENKK